MANYATEVYYLDQFIGELLAKLDELGLRENTILVFSSDQGAAVPDYGTVPVSPKECNLVGWSGGLRGQKHDQHEGGIRSPFILRWPGHVPAGKTNHVSITSALDWLPTLCRIAEVPIDPAEFQGEDVLDSPFMTHEEKVPEANSHSSCAQRPIAAGEPPDSHPLLNEIRGLFAGSPS